MTIYMIPALICAYLTGSIPSGLLIGRLHGIDIRTVGSHNIGATNVTRSIGRKAGIICFVCDFFKGAVPVWIAQWADPQHPETALLCCMAAVLGHMFPVYLKFKGGKGVATGAGGAFALAPVPVLIALAVWGAVFHISRYVSLASIVAAVMLPVSALLIRLWFGGISWLVIGLFGVIGILAVCRHRSNIVRLMNGTESRFERKKKEVEK